MSTGFDAHAVLRRALRNGGEYADLFLEKSSPLAILCEDDRLDKVIAGREHGAGLRVIAGKRTAYAYTNEITTSSLLELADAVGHAVENFFAKGGNPVGDAIALDAVTRAFAHIERATADGRDKDARWHMMMAALQAMMCGKGLGPVHALANTFGDQGLHHGAMVTIAMPAVLRAYEGRYPEKTKKLADAMGLKSGTPADAVAEMNARLGIPSTIRALGYKGGDLDELAQDSHESFFNATAPFHPSVGEYKALVEQVLG